MASTIKPIDGRSIHLIQSGQVIVDLCSVVKELVENSIDAGANNIDVRFKNQGLDLIEVQDNGSGISPANYHSIALKHHTSKLSSYSDIASLQTFGFRGEALASLCALSTLAITTCLESDVPKGSKLRFEASGKLASTAITAAQRGTTVSVEKLFHNLPVRRRELERNIKREWHKVIALLNQYACIQTKLKFSVSQQPTKGRRVLLFSTKGNQTTRENIINIFGSKAMAALVSLDLLLEIQPSGSVDSQSSVKKDQGSKQVRVLGHVSRPVHGDGRQTPDRQMFFVNGRPCGLPQFAKTFNEVYKSYNYTQSPFIFANILLDTNLYDVNVSPDKRSILLHDQSLLLDTLRSSLVELFDSHDYQLPTTQIGAIQPSGISKPAAKSEKTRLQEQDITFTPNSENPVPVEAGPEDESTSSSSESAEEEIQQPGSPAEVAAASKRDISKSKPRSLTRWLNDDTGLAMSPNSSVREEPTPDNFYVSNLTEQVSGTDLDGKSQPQTELADNVTNEKDSSFKLHHSPSVIDRQTGPQVQDRVSYSPSSRSSSYREDNNLTRQPRKRSGENIISSDSTKGILKHSPPAKRTCASGNADRARHLRSQKEQPSDPEVSESVSESDGAESECEAYRTTSKSWSRSNRRTGVLVKIIDSEKAHPPAPTVEEGTDRDVAIPSDSATEVTRHPVHADEQAVADDSLTTSRTKALETGIRKKYATAQLSQVVRLSESSLSSLSEQVNSYAVREEGGAADGEVENIAAPDAESKLSLIIEKGDFAKMRLVGQFNLGFIIAVRPKSESSSGAAEHDELFIIDQHASDEKFSFEKLQESTVLQSQRLVHPKVLELTALDEEIVLENLEALEANGFKIQVDSTGDAPVGSRCQLLALPLSRETTFSLTDLEELIALLADMPSGSEHIPRPSRVRKMFAMRACRSSIMIGKALTHSQMYTLLRHMGELDKPWNCPHGRPTMRHLCRLQAWDEGRWAADLPGNLAPTSWRSYCNAD